MKPVHLAGAGTWHGRPRPTSRASRLMTLALATWSVACSGPAERLSAQSDPVVAPTVVIQFTTGVENREPLDQVTFVESDIERIYLFSDLRGLAGQTVTHRWSFKGQTMAEVAFEVRGPRWRVWSSKELRLDWLGDWTVEIVSQDGEVFAAETFTYSASAR